MVYLPSARRQCAVAVRGATEQREALWRMEAPAGAGAPTDSKYPAPNQSTPEVYSHVNSGEISY